MKKISIGIATGVAMVAAVVLPLAVASAAVSTVPGPWTLNAPAGLVFACGSGSYAHTLETVSQNADGSFSGTGQYDANAAYTWDITGDVSGDTMTFTLIYTGSNAGYKLEGSGTIASDGSISGAITYGNCQSFSMPADSASQSFTGNHGQYVSSQTDKLTAAQSRIGMPTQSEGHTK